MRITLTPSKDTTVAGENTKKKKKIYDNQRCPILFTAFDGHHMSESGPEVKKLFSCSAQLRLKLILLINVKMPTIVGILTFISRINDRLWRSKPSISIYFGLFGIYEQFKFHAQLS